MRTSGARSRWVRRARAAALAALCAGGVAFVPAAGNAGAPETRAAAPPATEQAILTAPRDAGGKALLAAPLALPPESARKIDPRLLTALVARAPALLHAQHASGAGDSENLPARRIAVILRTALDETALAALGADIGGRTGDLVTARVAPGDLARLAADPAVAMIEGSARLEPLLDASIPEIRADLVHTGEGSYTGRGVIVGVVDTGIDHTHDDFRDADGKTRILSIWQQDAFVPSPPSGFGYGREYTREQIDRGLAIGHQDDQGHGSHVAGIAAGDGSSLSPRKYRGVAWEADLVIVRNFGGDMFTYGGAEPFGPGPTTVGTIDGLVYLIRKARALNKPLVVNLSQGTSMGPHDGTSLFEQMIDDLVRDEDLILCVAAGNSGSQGWHGRVRVTGATGRFTLQHTADPDPMGEILCECWYAPGDRFDWEIESPGGGVATVPGDDAPAGALLLDLGVFPDSVASWTTPGHPINGQGYALFWITNRSQGLAEGTWTVRAVAANSLPDGGVVDLYCERNQEGVRVVEGVTQAGTIGMPGSATEAISVGSYNTKLQWQGQDGWHTTAQLGYTENPLGAISTFSSQGPRRDGMLKPDLSAPGLIIAAVRSGTYVADAGFNDPEGEHTYLMGTSMACPHVAGAIALMLEKDPALKPEDVRSILQQTARRDAFTGATAGNVFGHGKLNVKAAVDAVAAPAECPTRAGDADGDDDVDVLDLVATVNDIIDRSGLGAVSRVCADMNGDLTLNVQDLTLIAERILGAGNGSGLSTGAGDGSVLSAHAGGAGGESEPDTLRWAESCTESAYRLTLSGAAVTGVQLAWMPPRGYAVAGEPRVRGAGPGSGPGSGSGSGSGDAGSVTAAVAHHERLGQHYLVAHASGALLAGPAGAVEIEIPLARHHAGAEDCARFAVTGLIASGPGGARVALAGASDAAGDPRPARTGVAAFLERVRPNPARGCATIRYTLGESSAVRIHIHDAAGRLVRRLHESWQMAGDHTLIWDGRDEHGRAAAAGAYFARLATGASTSSRRILLTR